MSNFVERLAAASRANQSVICVGLDPDPALMPIPDVFEFNAAIVDATRDFVCVYKPNMSFYEALGLPGLEALEKTVSYIRDVAPDVIVLADAKRGDIGSSNEAYARALFKTWRFDAATVNGYGGGESLEPFFRYEEKGVFVWCRSSNPGAKEFQDLTLSQAAEEIPLFERMASRASAWNTRGNVGLVVGATYPDELRRVRARSAGLPILIPGIGAQGGDLESSVRLGLDSGSLNVVVSSSRGIIYASRKREDFAEAARGAARDLRDRTNRILAEEGRGW